MISFRAFYKNQFLKYEKPCFRVSENSIPFWIARSVNYIAIYILFELKKLIFEEFFTVNLHKSKFIYFPKTYP